MVRMLKWLAPVAAFALLLGVSTQSKAADAAPAGGTVTGSVVDKDGKAVADMEVRIMKPMTRPNAAGGAPAPAAKAAGAGGRGGARPAPVATGKTDEKGNFKIENVPAGDYMVMVRDTTKNVGAREKVTVEAGKTVDVKLTLAEMPARGAGGAGGAAPKAAK